MVKLLEPETLFPKSLPLALWQVFTMEVTFLSQLASLTVAFWPKSACYCPLALDLPP